MEGSGEKGREGVKGVNGKLTIEKQQLPPQPGLNKKGYFN